MRVKLFLYLSLSLLVLGGCDVKGEAPLSPRPSASSAAPAPSSGPGSPDGGLSAADRVTLLQKTLEAEKLRPYWHPEVPGRVPVQVLKSEVVADAPALTLFGAPIVYVDDRSARPFEITKITPTDRGARVGFAHLREGVAGEVVFERTADGWRLVEQHVVER